MDGKEKRYWTCSNGHYLGRLERVKMERTVQGLPQPVKYHTSQLVLFRFAVDPKAGVISPEIAGSIVGRMLLGFRWRCSVPGCGCVRDWHPDEEALGWLKKRYEGSRVK